MKNKQPHQAFQQLSLLTLALASNPAFAADVQLEGAWDRVLAWVQNSMIGSTGVLLSTIALAVTGYLFFRGRIELIYFVVVVIGISLVFGAPTIVFAIKSVVG